MHGKHDLFSVEQAEYYEFKSGSRDFYVTHGHLIYPTYDNIFFFRSPLFVRFLYKIFVFLTNQITVFTKMFKKAEYKKNIKKLAALKNYSDKDKKDGQYFIFGHSHIPVLDLLESFISLGSLQKTTKSYCLIEDGNIILK